MRAQSKAGTILGIALTLFVTSSALAQRSNTTGGRGQSQTDIQAQQAAEEAARRARTGQGGTQTRRDDSASGGFVVPGQTTSSVRPAATQSAIVRAALANVAAVNLEAAGAGAATLRSRLNGAASVATIAVAMDRADVQASLADNSAAKLALITGANGVGRSIVGNGIVEDGEALAAQEVSNACRR